MLHDHKRTDPHMQKDGYAADRSELFLDFDKIFAAMRRQWRLVAVCGAIGAGLGIAYVATATPMYTAVSNLLIDESSNRILDDIAPSGGMLENEATVLSQIELLKSDRIADRVIDSLNLMTDPVLMGANTAPPPPASGKSFFNIASWFRSDMEAEAKAPVAEEPVDQKGRRLTARWLLASRLDITRSGRSYVLSIGYTSPSAELSARVAQAYAEAYLADQLDSKYEATRRASNWLQTRIDELRNQALQTDLAVQKFRADNGLIAADGRLVSEQQLSERNSQLTRAQTDVAEAQAKVERIQSLIAGGDTNAVVNDALVSTVITGLRTKYLETSKRAGEIIPKLGPDHQQSIRLRSEMADYRRLMFEELGRIAESYRSDLQVAKSREVAARASVQSATSISAGANETQVQLRELEREAETYKNLYQTFLQRYQETVQQQSIPITEARVINDAQPPGAASRPRKSMSLVLATILGLATGMGLGAFREFRDRFFRTADQVRAELGIEFLGSVPKVDDVPLADPKGSSPDAKTNHRYLQMTSSVSRYVLDNPMSPFAEALRSAKISGDLSIPHSHPKIIGVVSVLPGEGKSTISLNFAELLASNKSKVLLMDADIRNPGLTRAVAKHATVGIVDAVIAERPLQDVIMIDPQTRLSFIPAALNQRVPHTADILASPGMSSVLAAASGVYDYIVIDLPPLGPVVDVRAIASKIDAFIFVVEWGKTARRVVRSTLENNPHVAGKCLGVILNKVDSRKMKLYREFGSNEYYENRYEGYYHH